MVSRQTTRPLRKLVPAVAIGVGALLGIVGCGSGQVAQTAEMPPAVNGNSGQAGPLALRDVQVAFPENGEAYKQGEEAPLTLSIINSGATDDELVEVTSPAGKVEIVGNPKIPGRTTLQIVVPEADSSTSTSATTTEAPATSGEPTGTTTTGTATTTTTESAPQSEEAPVVGTASLVITSLAVDLPFGKNVPVTFVFASGAKVTIQLPVAAPSTPRPEPTEAAEGEH